MPNSRFCLGELSPAGALAVGTGAGALSVGTTTGSTAAVGAPGPGSGGVVATAAVGSAGVGTAAGSGVPPQLARIGSAITSIISAALIRIRARGIFTIGLLVERKLSVCSIFAIVHDIARMQKCAPAEWDLSPILSGSDDAFSS